MGLREDGIECPGCAQPKSVWAAPGGQIFSDVSIQETLDAHAANNLAESKDPHKMIELGAVNSKPALFADYGLGDSVRVSFALVRFRRDR